MNFFEWIRGGVRQAVLLGVSDAVDQIGTPEGDDLHQGLLEVLRSQPDSPKRLGSGTRRKKLGRSLQQIQATSEGAPS
jgi:hypothetical protein